MLASTAGGAHCAKPGRLIDDLQQVEWMICEFKTLPCSIEDPTSHDHRCCPFYHSGRDRRRTIKDGINGAHYKGEPCANQFDDARTCINGDACTMCHSTAELLYHPDFFRKRLCHQARRCPRSRFCAFAHNRQELLVPHFGTQEEGEPTEEFVTYRFKTQWCPVGGPHDWENCVYAHTYRDWRRVPILGYTSHPCPRWTNSVSNGTHEMGYTDRCLYGMACPLAHGAKEQLYHPQFYKTNPCSDSNCRRRNMCAFTHGEDPRQTAIEDMATKSARKPIQGAEEILKLYQPTYIDPPMYHALEDAPRSGHGAASGGKAKNRKGQQQSQQSRSAPGSASINLALLAPSPFSGSQSAPGSASINMGAAGDASQRVPMQMQQMQMPMMPGMTGARCATGASEPTMIVANGPFGPCMYQWVPERVNPLSQLASQLSCSPLRSSPVPAGTNPAYMAMQQPGPSPSPMDSPLRVNPRIEAEAEAEMAVQAAAKAQRMPGLPILLGLEAAAQGSPKGANAERDILAWQRGVERKYCQKDGYRTPSSWGSPPLSGAPTAENSPRAVMGYTDSSDHASLEESSMPAVIA